MKDQIGSGSSSGGSSSGRSADRQNKALLVLNIIFLTIGNCGGPLIIRLYFLNGGDRVWLSSWLQTGGWPVILLPLAYSYHRRRRRDAAAKLIQLDPFLFAASAGVGVLTGFDDYLYANGVARLPVTTSALIFASQLVFNAGFAYLLVRQKFTAYSVNAVVLLTIGGAVLALHTSGDRPKGESTREYVVGFVMTVAAAALYAFVLPLTELVYKKAKQEITYSLVLEIQTVMCFFATAFCTVGMIVHKDFQAIPREAKKFELGETKYYVVLVWSAIIWQGFFLGAIGVIFCASSLLSGIVISVLLPVAEILAVIFYQESFQAQKGVSLALCLWGFVSYFYGEFKHDKKNKKNKKEHNADQETELPQIQNSPTTERYSLNP